MRVMRKNYDKPHQCPAWSGPGYVYKGDLGCPGRSIHGLYYGKLWQWKCHRHAPCGTLTLPYVLRWLDWRTYTLRWDRWRFNRNNDYRSKR